MPSETTPNPLVSETPGAWTALIEAVNPASLLVLINRKLGADLRARVGPEDVFQEALLHAWRDRERHAWQGPRAFRRWLVEIINHRICDLADRAASLKRGAGRRELPIEPVARADASSAPPVYAGPVATTTPSRSAADAELARTMEEALDEVPDQAREVLRLRVFEDLTMEEAATRTGLSFAAARHWLRKGGEAYQRALARRLGSEVRVGDRSGT